MRKAIAKIYACALCAGAAYWLLIQLTGVQIPCLYRAVSGYLCPGCGVTRMFGRLMALDFLGALQYNPAVFGLLTLWNAIAVLCFWGKPEFCRRKSFLWGAFWTSIGILIFYGIARNIY